MRKILAILFIALSVMAWGYDINTTIDNVSISGVISASEVWQGNKEIKVLGSASCTVQYPGATAYHYIYQDISTTQMQAGTNSETTSESGGIMTTFVMFSTINVIDTTYRTLQFPAEESPYSIQTVVNPEVSCVDNISFSYAAQQYHVDEMYTLFACFIIEEMRDDIARLRDWVEYQTPEIWRKINP